MTEAEMIENHKKESKKKIEKAEPTFWIVSNRKGKKAGFKKLERAQEIMPEFQSAFPDEEFYIEREMPVDVLVIAAGYIANNNHHNIPMPFGGWVADYTKKRMAALYGENNNCIL